MKTNVSATTGFRRGQGRVRVAPSSECFGREHELAQLDALTRAAVTQQRGQVAAVTGPAGIGKTRLVEELMRRERELGVATYEGTARHGDPPYSCVAELVDAIVIGLRAEGTAP